MSAGTESPVSRPSLTPAMIGIPRPGEPIDEVVVTEVARDKAGLLLRRLSLLPLLLASAWLLAGLPLLLLGVFSLVPMLLLSVPIAAALVLAGLRYLPALWPEPIVGQARSRTPWWAVASVLAIVIVFAIFQMIYHSQYLMVSQDPGSYFQFSYWIAHHGFLPIPQDLAAFGPYGSHLTFDTPAFYQVGNVIDPQFMAGLPLVLSAGFWAGGTQAALLIPPLLGAGALLTFGGLVARLVGVRWAPLAVLVLAVTEPQQYVSRNTLSETLAQILFLGGMCLVIDSLQASGRQARILAALGGLALGLTMLVRIDGLSDILMVIPYGGLLLLTRRPQAIPLLGGLAAGLVYGAADGLLLSRPYLASLRSVLVPLVLIVIVITGATMIVLMQRWGKGLPRLSGKWPGRVMLAAPAAVVLFLAARPYLMPVHVNWSLPPLVRKPQVEFYFFQFSLHWVLWYGGIGVLILGTFGAMLLARRCLHGEAPSWTLPLLLFGWSIVTVLYRPAITPIHPWAGRRLAPAVLPGLIILAVWGASWLAARARQSGMDRLTIRAGYAAATALLVVPAAFVTFGFDVRPGPGGVPLPHADGLAFKRTFTGEIAAIDGLCQALPANSSVIIVDHALAGNIAQVVRGMCGLPTAVIDTTPDLSNVEPYARPDPRVVAQAVSSIRAAGRQPVLLAADQFVLMRYGSTERRVMFLQTRVDDTIRQALPRNTIPVELDIFMMEPGS